MIGSAGAARDNRARMSHSPTWRRGRAGDEADHGLLHLAALDELGAIFLGRAADLANHDDRLRVGVGQKHLEHVDEIRAIDRVAANADAGRLAEPNRCRLGDRLIGQRAGARDDADMALLVDVTRHDSDLAFARRYDARTVRADEAALGAG